jgi:hypothetical protein
MEENERRRRLAVGGKHTFLKRGEGIKAADQSAKVMKEREKEEKAKYDIANYSLSHAKKGGLVDVNSNKKSKVTTSNVEYIEVSDRNNELDKKWNEQWSAEDEMKFSNESRLKK